MADFVKRFNKILNEKNITQTELSKLTGITQSSISDWARGKYLPRQDKVYILSKALKVSPSYLLGYDDDIQDLSSIPGIIPVKAIKKIPILGSIVCGYPVWSAENYQGYYPSDPDIFAADFCLYADGDSMVDANIHDGDLVFFKKTPDVENGTIVAALIDGDATLKKFTKTNEAIILSPCNDTYHPIIINKDDGKEVRILGEMIAVLSKRNK